MGVSVIECYFERQEDFEHHRIMVFEDHWKDFSEGLKKALNFLNIKKKAYNQEEVRKVWKKAYMHHKLLIEIYQTKIQDRINKVLEQ